MKPRSRRSRRRLSPPAVALVASLTIATVDLVGEKLMDELSAITAMQVHARERVLSPPPPARSDWPSRQDADTDLDAASPGRGTAPTGRVGLPFRGWSEMLPGRQGSAPQRHSRLFGPVEWRLGAAQIWDRLQAELAFGSPDALAIPEPTPWALGSVGGALGWLLWRSRRT